MRDNLDQVGSKPVNEGLYEINNSIFRAGCSSFPPEHTTLRPDGVPPEPFQRNIPRTLLGRAAKRNTAGFFFSIPGAFFSGYSAIPINRSITALTKRGNRALATFSRPGLSSGLDATNKAAVQINPCKTRTLFQSFNTDDRKEKVGNL